MNTIVYRCPGRHKAGHNQTYDFMNINDEDKYKEALDNGWKKTLEEAKEIYTLEPKEPKKTEYRKKLESLASQIGVKFTDKTKDTTLHKNIEKAANEGKKES